MSCTAVSKYNPLVKTPVVVLIWPQIVILKSKAKKKLQKETSTMSLLNSHVYFIKWIFIWYFIEI